MTIPITKHSTIVKDVEALADTIREAFHIATSGRPGPVLIDVPKDVQAAKTEFTPKEPKQFIKATKPCAELLQKAAALIQKSERPFIYAGGGVVISDAARELVAFCERIDAPVGSSMMGLSAMPFDHPNHLGMLGMHGKYAATQALYDSDLLIAVGTRFSDRATGNKSEFSADRAVIQIDIDPAEMCKNIPANVCLEGDVKDILTQLLALVPEKAHAPWHAHIQEMKNSKKNSMAMNPDLLTPEYIIEKACDHMGDNVIATDVGQHQMWATQYYKFKKPRTFVTSGGLGAMGFRHGRGHRRLHRQRS